MPYLVSNQYLLPRSQWHIGVCIETDGQKDIGRHWLDPSNGVWWPLTCLLTPVTALIDSGPVSSHFVTSTLKKKWKLALDQHRDHVSLLPLQSVWLPGWRKWEWCVMIIWLTGSSFVSGVICWPAEEMTWALEDRKAIISLALCTTVASFL